MRTILVVGSSLALAAFGCKDRPTKEAPVATVGAPPKQTTRPHTKQDYERLSKLEVPGFTKEVRLVGDNAMEVRYKTQDRPKLWAVVTLHPCVDCQPMDLARWKAHEQELKASTLEVLQHSKDVDWELGETQLNGQQVIYVYQVGTGSAPGEGGDSYSFTNTYVAYYNDGVNDIRVVGSYKDDPVAKEDLQKLAPKQRLRTLALSFLELFTHAW